MHYGHGEYEQLFLQNIQLQFDARKQLLKNIKYLAYVILKQKLSFTHHNKPNHENCLITL